MSHITEKWWLLFQRELADSIVVSKVRMLRLDGNITIILYFFYNINIHLWIHGGYFTCECEISVDSCHCIQISMLYILNMVNII